MCPKCAQARSNDHHSAPNANQVPNEKRAEISELPASSVIPGGLSKPPPSASRPPHRGEKAKYTTGFDLRSTLLSPELSLKLSLPARRTGAKRSRLRLWAVRRNAAVLFDGYQVRKPLMRSDFPACAGVHFFGRARVRQRVANDDAAGACLEAFSGLLNRCRICGSGLPRASRPDHFAECVL